MENKNICIDLNKVIKGDVIYYPINELIHREQIMRVGNILLGRMKEAEEYTPGRNGEFKHQTDIISVFARRGAGKTTFVQSLIKLIQYSNEEPFSTLGKDLYCLELLDPNNTERKENLTIRLIAQIHHVFQKAADNIRHQQSENYERVYNDRERLIENFDRATQDLYKTLPVLDGIGDPCLYSNWDDSVYLSDRFMELTINASKLEKCFHLYLDAGLRLIQKKALLFVLDDCDIKINNTFQILEIIRLYFTSPQIIVIMTGDASLYGMAIRKHFWQYFEKEFLDKEMAFSYKEHKFKEYQKMVNRLEAQYFQKMIRAEYRIFLNNLYDKIQYDNQPVYIKYTIDSNGEGSIVKEIKELYNEAFNLVGISRKNYKIFSEFMNHMLAQPFRNQIRFFIAYYHALNTKENQTSTFVRGVLKIFEVYINQYSGDSKYLMGHSPVYPAWMLKFLVENNLLFTGASFLPEIEDDSLKNIIIALCFSFYEQVKHNSFMIFDYWIRISLTHQWLSEIKDNKENINDFITQSCLYTDCGLSKILGNMSVLAMNKNGTVILPGLFETKKSLVGKSDNLNKLLIQLLQLQIQTNNGNVMNIFSVYRIFAFLGELLRDANDVKKELTNSIERQLDSHWDLLKKNSQIRLYIGNQNKEEITEIHNIEDVWLENLTSNISIENENGLNSLILFYKHVFEWERISFDNELVIQPYWIDHIFTRFYHTIHHFNSKIKLNDYINNSILAFWNALIVEGFYADNSSNRIQNDQNGDIREIFFKNYLSYLFRYKNEKSSRFLEQDLLLQWLLYCPILHKYINPLISKFIIIARLHLEGLKENDDYEKEFIELLMNSKNTNNKFSNEKLFSENDLIALYMNKICMPQNETEISCDKKELLSSLIDYYNLYDNSQIYELLKVFSIEQEK